MGLLQAPLNITFGALSPKKAQKKHAQMVK